MRYELKSVRIWAFTKVSFFVNLPIGFLFGLIYAGMLPFMMIGMAQFGGFPGQAIDPSEFPIGAMLIMLPLMGAMFAAVFHTLFGIVLLAIYNLIVRMIGGLEFELDPIKVASVAAPPRPVATYADLTEAAVSVPPVSGIPSPTKAPPPPPVVPGVVALTVPPVAPTPDRKIPDAAPETAVKPVTPEVKATPSVLPSKQVDDKPDNDPPPAPETT